MSYELTRRRVFGAIGTAAAAGVLGVVPAAGQRSGGWPQRRHDGANTSADPTASGLRSQPSTSSLIAGRELSGSLLAAGGSLYSQQGLGTLSVRADTGDERWSRFTGDPAAGGIPIAVTHGQVYALTPSGAVAALDAASGDPQWRYSGGGRGIPVVAVSGDTVHVAIGSTLAALNPAGETRWERPLGSRARAAATDGNSVYLSTGSGLVAVDEESMRWSRGIDARGLPVVAGGRLLVQVADADGLALSAFDVGDGREQWRGSDLSAPVTTPPAVTSERVYVGAGSDPLASTFFALDAATGRVEWAAELGNPTTASASPASGRPAVAGDTVYVTSADGTINALDAASGERLWRQSLDREPGLPVPADGKLYVTVDDSAVVVFESSGDDGTGSQQGSDDSGDDGNGGTDPGEAEDDGTAANGSTDSDDGSGPGLGVGSALAGVAGASLLWRRRQE